MVRDEFYGVPLWCQDCVHCMAIPKPLRFHDGYGVRVYTCELRLSGPRQVPKCPERRTT